MNELNRQIFSGMKILSDDGWLTDHAVVVENDIIDAIVPSSMIPHHLPAQHHEYHQDCYLIPGLIDLHIHGIAGYDVMDATLEAHEKMSHALALNGVTGYLATTMTANVTHIEAALKATAEAKTVVKGAAILGVHLEGPFIAKEKLGAQTNTVQSPNIDLFRHWQSIAQDSIKIVTLAPELPEIDIFIATLRKMNVIASIGHTAATYEQTQAAILAGCTHATHLFNAMSGIHQRAPGAVTAILLANTVSSELIVDGVHLHPGIVGLAMRCKGKERLMLVTDAMRAACLKDGRYELGGSDVIVADGVARLQDNTLAGSTLCLMQAIKNMAAFTDCSLHEAVKMATANPARILGLYERKGSIAANKDADLVVVDADMNVKLTMRAGLVLSEQRE